MDSLDTFMKLIVDNIEEHLKWDCNWGFQRPIPAGVLPETVMTRLAHIHDETVRFELVTYPEEDDSDKFRCSGCGYDGYKLPQYAKDQVFLIVHRESGEPHLQKVRSNAPI